MTSVYFYSLKKWVGLPLRCDKAANSRPTLLTVHAATSTRVYKKMKHNCKAICIASEAMQYRQGRPLERL